MSINYFSLLLLLTGLGSVATFPECPREMGWAETDESCAKFLTGTTYNRTLAIEECKEQFGDKATLATIKDETESKILGSLPAGSSWLGLQRATDDEWHWDDETVFKFTNWSPGEPNNNMTYRCAFFDEAELWNSTTCDKKYKVICEAPKEHTWKNFNDFDYYAKLYVHGGVTWSKARENCMSMGADLMTITTHDQYTTMNGWLKDYDSMPNRKLWIGLKATDFKTAETDWRWSDGTRANLFYWNGSFPISTIEGAGCVYTIGHSSPRGRWMNSNCGIKRDGYICKRPTNYDGGPITDRPPTPATGYCPTGYFSVEERCVKVFAAGSKTWYEALEACRKEPGKDPDLVSIPSLYASVVIMSHLAPDTTDLWIGGYRLEEDSWGWSDQTSYGDFTNFETENEFPCLSIGKPGVSLGRWSPDKCEKKKAFICQTRKDPERPIPTAEPHPLECPQGFTARNKHCYMLNKDKLPWTTAYKDCVGRSASLVTIDTEPDNQFVFSKVIELAKEIGDIREEVYLWIGLHDMTNTGEYEWIDNSKLNYTAWGRGQPKRAVAGGCVSLRESGDWHGLGIWEDKNCSATYFSMCRVPTAATPASTANISMPSFRLLIQLVVLLLHLNRRHVLVNN